MKKKNIFILSLIITASYLSYNGISYERAVLENTMLPCCDNDQCIDRGCDTPCSFGSPPDEWIGTAMDCVLLGGAPYCNLTDNCEYWGPGDIRCDNLAAGISGPSYVSLPNKGSTTTATWSASVSGGLSPYTYSWQLGGSTGSSSTFTHTFYFASTSWTTTVYLTVSSSDGQTVSVTKSVDLISPLDP